MLYAILQPLMRLALRIFFRKIYFSNAEVIPWGKPLIIASNHPTAFMEPLIYCSFLRQPLHSITRGDVFARPFFGKILKSLYMVPIFRFKDGFGNLKLNNASFEHCYQTLADKKAILIFSEGRTKLEKRLRPIQKGTARMAFGTWESLGNTDLDIQIVPVGLNYVSGNCFRDEVMIRFDAPISLREYEKMYHENPIRSVTKLTEELKNKLEKLVIIVADTNDDEFAEQLLTIRRNELYDGVLPIVSESNKRLEAEKRVADRICQMSDDEKVFWKKETADYFKKLDENSIKDDILAKNIPIGWKNQTARVLGFLPATIGYVANILPVSLAQRIANKRVSADHVEFFTPVLIGSSLLLYLIYYLFLLIFAGIFNQLIVWLCLLILPFLGYYAVTYYEFNKKFKTATVLNKLNETTITDLRLQRKFISRLEKI